MVCKRFAGCTRGEDGAHEVAQCFGPVLHGHTCAVIEEMQMTDDVIRRPLLELGALLPRTAAQRAQQLLQRVALVPEIDGLSERHDQVRLTCVRCVSAIRSAEKRSPASGLCRTRSCALCAPACAYRRLRDPWRIWRRRSAYGHPPRKRETRDC